MQNLRSSRLTELAQTFPIQTVTAWLGNTPKVALENYLQARDEDFAKAVQIPVQQPSVMDRFGSQPLAAENNKPLVSQAFPTKQGVSKLRQVPPLGLEPTLDAVAETAVLDCCAARALQNGRFDSGLDRLIELWSRLSELDRLALVDHAEHLIPMQNQRAMAGQ